MKFDSSLNQFDKTLINCEPTVNYFIIIEIVNTGAHKTKPEVQSLQLR